MTTPTAEPQLFLSAAQITSLVPGIDEEWASLYEAAITSVLAELTGGTGEVPASVEPRVRLLLVTAIQRHGMAKPWLKSETIGPFSATYEKVADELLTDRTLAKLEALLGVPSSAPATAGGARGTFPPAGGYDHLFASPGALPGPVGVVVYSVTPPAPGAEPPVAEPIPGATTMRTDFARHFADDPGGTA